MSHAVRLEGADTVAVTVGPLCGVWVGTTTSVVVAVSDGSGGGGGVAVGESSRVAVALGSGGGGGVSVSFADVVEEGCTGGNGLNGGTGDEAFPLKSKTRKRSNSMIATISFIKSYPGARERVFISSHQLSCASCLAYSLACARILSSLEKTRLYNVPRICSICLGLS